VGKLKQDNTGRWCYKPGWYERDKVEVAFEDPEAIVQFGDRVLSEPRMLTTEWMVAWVRARQTTEKTFHQKRLYESYVNARYGERRTIRDQYGERTVGGITREYIVDETKNVRIPGLAEKFSMPTVLAWIVFCLTNVLPDNGNLDEMAKVADELNPQAVMWYIQGVYEGEPEEKTRNRKKSTENTQKRTPNTPQHSCAY